MKNRIVFANQNDYGTLSGDIRKSIEEGYDFDIVLFISPGKTVKELIDEFLYSGDVNTSIDYYNDNPDDFDFFHQDQYLDYLNSIKDNIGAFKREIMREKQFFLDMNIEEAAEFFEENKFLHDKNIVLSDVLDFNEENINKIKSLFGDRYKLVKFMIPGNVEPVSLDDVVKTNEFIDNITDHIKELGLSPFESILYAFDIARDRKYQKGSGENYYESRDLTSSLFGNAIVCVGFSAFFKAILDKLDIPNNKYLLGGNLDDLSIGHQSNIAYVKDDKYGIDGVYFFDPTWGCKKDDTDNHFYSYKYFARTKEEFDKNGYGKYITSFLADYKTEDAVDFANKFHDGGSEAVDREFADMFNMISRMIDGKSLFQPALFNPDVARILISFGYDASCLDTEKLFDETMKIIKLMNSPIPGDVLLNALYAVRKVQIQEADYKYPFSSRDFCKTLVFSGRGIDSVASPVDRFFFEVYGEYLDDKIERDGIEFMKKNEEMSKDMDYTKLARVLKRYVDSKEE